MLLVVLSAHALAAPPPAVEERRGLVLPELPAPRLHPELARPTLAFAPPERTWEPVVLLAAPDLVSGLFAGAVSVSAQSMAQDATLRQGSILPGARAGQVSEPPRFPEQAP